MIKFALYLLMISDSIFNTWGDIHSGYWRIFIDLIHYSAFIIIASEQIKTKKFDWEYLIFIGYFSFIVINQFVLLFKNPNSIDNNVYNYWTFYALILILIYIIVNYTRKLNEKI